MRTGISGEGSRDGDGVNRSHFTCSPKQYYNNEFVCWFVRLSIDSLLNVEIAIDRINK